MSIAFHLSHMKVGIKMEIKKVSDYKGLSRFGRCAECGELETDFNRLCRLQFNGESICLCPPCFIKTRAAMNDIIVDQYEFIGKK